MKRKIKAIFFGVIAWFNFVGFPLALILSVRWGVIEVTGGHKGEVVWYFFQLPLFLFICYLVIVGLLRLKFIKKYIDWTLKGIEDSWS
tara:strand:+ start:1575 stop:1838 length:264 start_codon:yes stop_codon:yes gene_type:complete